MMDYLHADYTLADPSQVASPALLFYKDLIRHNIYRMIQRAGGPERLRPHVKTHKTREIVRMQREAGIEKHKAATIAEAEMLAQEGVPDVFLAYPLVGPAATRFARLVQTYADTAFSTVVDSPEGAKGLSASLFALGLTAETLLDLDVGQHRTGIATGPKAAELYASLMKLPGLRPGGLHVYDGHNHQEPLIDRKTAVEIITQKVLHFRDQLLDHDLPVPRMVVGGTPTFPVWCELTFPGVELSPGTCVLNDHGYGSRFRDMDDLVCAAAMLTRVVSKPTPTRLTLDLGNKAVASDPPAGKRVRVLGLDPHEQAIHNEEHLVLETPLAESVSIGSVFYALPTHICPTCALHQEALIVQDRRIVDAWPIVARDRRLTI